MEATVVAITDRCQRLIEKLADAINRDTSLGLMASLDFDRVQVHSARGAFIYSIYRERRTIWVQDHSQEGDDEFDHYGKDLENEDEERLLDDLVYYIGWHSKDAIRRAHSKLRANRLMAAALANEIEPEE